MDTSCMDTPSDFQRADSELAVLRRAVLNDPRNGELRYMLGAHMAQERDYDSAVLEFSAAIALNPQLHVARFQLGLLHLTLAQPQHALTVLAPLEDLGDSAALKHFKRGLEALIRDDFASCIEHLRQGVQLNHENGPLNKDMTMLIERAQAAKDAQQVINTPAPAVQPLEVDADADAVRTDFSLYGLTKH